MLEEIALGCFALVVLAMVRNVLTCRWQMRAADEAHELNLADINALSGPALMAFDSDVRYAAIPDYYAVMFDLTQWRYRSPFATTAEATKA